jgi:hypothetical protein
MRRASGRDRADNVRSGYQGAIELWSYCGQTVWSTLSAALISQSIMILGFVEILGRGTKIGTLFWFSPILPVLGIGLLWQFCKIINRHFGYMDYYVGAANELEGLLPPVDTVHEGGRLQSLSPLRARDGVNAVIAILGLLQTVLLVAWLVRVTSDGP